MVVEVKAVGDQLPRGPDPPRALSADARAAVDAGHRDRRRDRGRPPGASGSSGPRAVATPSWPRVDEQWLFDLPDGAIVRGGRSVPDGVPHRLDPAHPPGRDPPRRARARARRRRRRRQRGGRRSRATSAPRSSRRRARTRSSRCPCRSARRRPSPTTGLDEIEPVDVVFDPVGGQLFADSIKLAAAARGRASRSASPAAPGSRVDPALLVGRNVGVQGFYLGRLMQRTARIVREAARDAAAALGSRAGAADRRRDLPARRGGRGAPRSSRAGGSTGKVVLVP